MFVNWACGGAQAKAAQILRLCHPRCGLAAFAPHAGYAENQI
jgi:hypothetical protein